MLPGYTISTKFLRLPLVSCLAYRWFCRLGLEGAVPERSTFSKNRDGCFHESELLRRLFESVLQRCIAEGLSVTKALPSTPV
jgi:transposase